MRREPGLELCGGEGFAAAVEMGKCGEGEEEDCEIAQRQQEGDPAHGVGCVHGLDARIRRDGL